MRLPGIDMLRGLAILLVIASHCYFAANFVPDTWAERTLRNVLSGATVIFVFVSGVMFHHVFARRYHYRTFLTKKLAALVPPYLLVSAPFLVMLAFSVPAVGPYEGIGDILRRLLVGQTFIAYWYIPFILLTFVASPLHMAFIAARPVTRWIVFAVLLAVSLVLHRSEWDLNPLQSLVYFTPVYLAGILYSLHREALAPYLPRLAPVLVLTALAVALTQAHLVTHG
ncbi:MAG: acyltransferase, partial [Pseudomonadota bacterium]